MSVQSDSPIQNLLDLAADLRRKADVYEKHAHQMLAELGMSHSVRQRQRPVLPSTSSPVKQGKQPGAITSKWQGVLRELAGTSHLTDQPFTYEQIAEVVLRRLDREMKPAEIKRHFKPYINAGYLQQPSRDVYEFTRGGHEKIEFEPPQLREHDFPEQAAPLDELGLE